METATQNQNSQPIFIKLVLVRVANRHSCFQEKLSAHTVLHPDSINSLSFIINLCTPKFFSSFCVIQHKKYSIARFFIFYILKTPHKVVFEDRTFLMKSIRFVAMKPCCRIPIPRRNSSFFGLPLPKSKVPFARSSSNYHFNSIQKHNFQTFSRPISRFSSILKQNQKPFSAPSSSWGQARVFSTSYCDGRFTNRGLYVVAGVASNIRNLSTSVETRINDKNFERIYVQGGLNVKPLVVEKTQNNEGGNAKNGDDGGGTEKNDNFVGQKEAEPVRNANREEVKAVKTEGREESQIEKEAWNLLQNVVVTYCGSPVGTLAANDPNDKVPLNYDQVFVRDFVPSALAFLLKGDTEIVRNFLLHNLQLQVFIIFPVYYCCI